MANPERPSPLLEIITADYQNFPHNQTYSIYAEDVFFKDPMTEFRGLAQYQKMIQFMTTWFKDSQLDLQGIEQEGDRIKTQWILSWTTPLPWQPRITISGHTEMILNQEDKVISHIDVWDCSPWSVLQQHFVI
ncbi:DUF2358 domain-containing protein [Prochlorothrix hollandica]|uniref:DUF2358 domain-containing protein n=1 Tax=Prochlorothrix hollandica PCC 9006 = CALU 1027 TaxID=317619 RepID=A0A0M2PWP5_PROHO|nr:DUF2358 domain-containing protein [Prochlorothrix hollandica]KKI99507.1 hypothetical protein PROH_13020 [Prochlorothrix hollandica PCC 9006 = CALU 1027]